MFEIKRNTTLPTYKATLQTNVEGFDLTQAIGASFAYRLKGTSERFVKAAVIADAAARVVRYDWQTDDVTRLGIFEAQFEITFPGGTWVFPHKGFFEFEVTDSI